MEIEWDKSKMAEMIGKLDKLDKRSGEKAEQILTAVADKVIDEAQKRAPVDEGFLEGSFRRKITSGASIGDVEAYVYIPINDPAAKYALYMHELTYKLGPKSKEKQSAVGVKVGWKFLERALTENVDEINIYIQMKLKEWLEGLT